MNSDIRIKTNFPQHIKTKKLIKKLGYEGFYSLISLWCYAAENKPKGILTNMTIEDIAIASNWSGDAESFVDALVRCGFLERDDGGQIILHDWQEHNRFVYYAPERSALARQNIEKRWQKRHKNTQNNTAGIQTEYQSYTNGIPVVYQPDTPIPSPIPSPIPIPNRNMNSIDNEKQKKTSICTQSETDFVQNSFNKKVIFDEKVGTFMLNPDLIEKYKEAYPLIDVQAEIKKMEAWVLSQPKSRWKKNWQRFIIGWLGRQQDKAEFRVATTKNNGKRGILDD